MSRVFSGINSLEFLIRKGFFNVHAEEDGQDAVDIVHRIANATNQLKYNAAIIREMYDTIGMPQCTLRFFNFANGELEEVREEDYRGEYTPKQEIPD